MCVYIYVHVCICMFTIYMYTSVGVYNIKPSHFAVHLKHNIINEVYLI